MRSLTEMAAALLKDTVDASCPRLGQFTRPFTHQEEYLTARLVSAGEVSVACDQLHYALAYLSGYQSRKMLGGELITRADHIAYQMENLYLRLGMIPDRSLRLTNEVFCLGLPPRECNARTVTDNYHVRRTAVSARLRAIDKVVQPHREARNTIAHFGRYNDDALSEVETFFILQKSHGAPDEPLLERARHFYKHEADVYVDSKRTQLGPVARSLVAEVARLFEALLPVFTEKHAALG